MTQIIFLHILKCGGTSLRHMLLEQYGYDAIAPVPVGLSPTSRNYPYMQQIDPLVYQEMITPEMVTQYSVVMGHYDWRIVDRLPDRQIITLFRHPVSQLYSLFRFMKRMPTLVAMHPEMQPMTFYNWLTSEYSKPYLNTQTRYLSGHGIENLDTAMRNLTDERLTFGLVDRFEESTILFNRCFNWSLVERHENTDRHHLAKAWMAADYELAESLQNDDMVLYQAACELFEERIRSVSV
jgi:hypothetical protein